MIYAVPYKGPHFAALGSLQAAQSDWRAMIAPEQAAALATVHSNTIMLDGRPLVCAGILPVWEGRGYIWSFFSSRMTPRLFVAAHRLARQFVENAPFKRIEAAVEVGFDAGHRWLEMLGFTCETPTTVARSYLPNGADCLLYARIKD